MVTTRDQVNRVLECMRSAAAANRATPRRCGNIIELTTDTADEVMIAGDLHGNRLNFAKLLRQAQLAEHPRRHLVMQEVCHGGPTYPASSGCMSHLLLEDMATLKNTFPEQFHFILSNHELAELTDFAIIKSGRMLNLSFRTGLQDFYGEHAEDIRQAYLEFLISCPLGVRLQSGVFISHSVPVNVDCSSYDCEIFHRPLGEGDFRPQGPIFRLVWGRDFREQNAAAFAKLVNADVLVHGHEPCSIGYLVPNTRQVILDCCGDDACFAILPVSGTLTHQDVVGRIQHLSERRGGEPQLDQPNATSSP